MTFLFFEQGRKGVETTSLDELSRLAKVWGVESKDSGIYIPKFSSEVHLRCIYILVNCTSGCSRSRRRRTFFSDPHIRVPIDAES